MTRLPLLETQQFSPEGRVRVRRELVDAAHTGKPARRRGRRFFVVAGAAVLVVAGGGTATGFALLGSGPVTDHSSARCYAKVSDNFGDDFEGTTVAQPESTGQQVTAPISACALAWSYGILQGIAPPDADPPYPVPDLVGCVLPNGQAAVFPGTDGTCARLGLKTALSDTSP